MVLPTTTNSNKGSLFTTLTTTTKKKPLQFAIVLVVLLILFVLTRLSSTSTDTTSTGSGSVKVKTSSHGQSHIALDIPPPEYPRDDGFRLCQAWAPKHHKPALGGPPVLLTKQVAPLGGIPYQCAGPLYEQFADQLQGLLQNTTKANWGKRREPIPPHAVPADSSTRQPPPTFVLFMGNSHLRQIVTALLCQYSEWIISSKLIYASKHQKEKALNTGSWQLLLKGNIHVFVVINPPFVYHDSWQDLLERHVLNMPLAMMDVIVMSKFHLYTKKQGIAFEEFWMDHENDWTVPDTVHADPINFGDLLLPSDHNDGGVVYEKNLIYVSMFAEYGMGDYHRAVQIVDAMKSDDPAGHWPRDTRDPTQMEQLDHDFQKPQAESQAGITKDAEERLSYKPPPPPINGGGRGRDRDRQRQRRHLKSKTQQKGLPTQPRTNLKAINARQYVSQIGECSSKEAITKVGTCVTDTNSKHYSNGLKCLGYKGGHPDLVAWDVIEAMHQLLWKHGSGGK